MGLRAGTCPGGGLSNRICKLGYASNTFMFMEARMEEVLASLPDCEKDGIELTGLCRMVSVENPHSQLLMVIFHSG